MTDSVVLEFYQHSFFIIIVLFYVNGKCVMCCDDVTGHVLATVRAHDVDSDENARLRYELTTDSAGDVRLFRVDSHSGQLSFTEKLPLSANEVYSLLVTASDHGDPPMSTSTTLTVVVSGLSAAQEILASSGWGVSVYVTSAVCVGCVLLVVFLIVVAVTRRRRHDNHLHRHHHRHHHEKLTSSRSVQSSQETAHILPSYVADKQRPLRDLEPSDLANFPAHRRQVRSKAFLTL